MDKSCQSDPVIRESGPRPAESASACNQEQPRCATCRHWQPSFGDREARDIVVGHQPPEYEATYPPYEVRFCRSPLLVFREHGYSLPPSNGAVIADGSEYFAALVTGADFGCVNHEPEPVAHEA